jgi:2-iminobutanoate/2-iminopropanoate deaminase
MDQPQPVSTPDAPQPAGHYSQAVVHRGIVYVSGQLPIEPGVGPPRPGESLPGVTAQTRRVMENLRAVLAAAGSGPRMVLRCTVYVSDVGLWPEVNRAYAEFFTAHGGTPPARTVVPTGPLHYGYSVEIDAIASVDGEGA